MIQEIVNQQSSIQKYAFPPSLFPLSQGYFFQPQNDDKGKDDDDETEEEDILYRMGHDHPHPVEQAVKREPRFSSHSNLDAFQKSIFGPEAFFK